MKTFWLGVAATILVGLVTAGLVAWTGCIDIAAARRTDSLDRLLGYASTRSIRRHAPRESNPLGNDPAALDRGRDHYREMCVDCHGGPGKRPEEFASGLHPTAPDLTVPEIQHFSDGMLYWVIARGLHSTGMPAFEATHRPEDIWAIVAYVRHLPAEAARASASRSSTTGTTGGQGGARVAISGMKFDPATLEVHVGDLVTWTNNDFVAHTATSDDGKTFDSGNIDPRQSRQVVAAKKGTFPYNCRYHSSMRGTLIVR